MTEKKVGPVELKRMVLSHVNNFGQGSDEMLSRITDRKVFISFNKTIFSPVIIRVVFLRYAIFCFLK